jgi:hypothetical protein
VVDVLLLLGLEYHSGSFIFLVSFSISWLRAFVLPLGYCIVAEARYNWYLSILIYSLYKKSFQVSLGKAKVAIYLLENQTHFLLAVLGRAHAWVLIKLTSCDHRLNSHTLFADDIKVRDPDTRIISARQHKGKAYDQSKRSRC